LDCPPETEAEGLSFKGLTADNPSVQVARFIVRPERFAAAFTDRGSVSVSN
jgi:hypothetical protein